MNPRTVVFLSLSAISLGCAPGRVGSPPAGAPSGAPPLAAPSPAASAGPSPAPAAARVEFETQIRPLLEEKCTPCHFPGGRMYDRLPFDREETIRTLGEALYTRLKDPVDVDLVRTFLEQKNGAAATRSGP